MNPEPAREPRKDRQKRRDRRRVAHHLRYRDDQRHHHNHDEPDRHGVQKLKLLAQPARDARLGQRRREAQTAAKENQNAPRQFFRIFPRQHRSVPLAVQRRQEKHERPDNRHHRVLDIGPDQAAEEIAEYPSRHATKKHNCGDGLAGRKPPELRILAAHHRRQIGHRRRAAQQREIQQQPAAHQEHRRHRHAKGHPLREAEIHAVGLADVALEHGVRRRADERRQPADARRVSHRQHERLGDRGGRVTFGDQRRDAQRHRHHHHRRGRVAHPHAHEARHEQQTREQARQIPSRILHEPESDPLVHAPLLNGDRQDEAA